MIRLIRGFGKNFQRERVQHQIDLAPRRVIRLGFPAGVIEFDVVYPRVAQILQARDHIPCAGDARRARLDDPVVGFDQHIHARAVAGGSLRRP